MYPDKLEGISPALKKRMMGKLCFYFKQVDKALLAELKTLTGQGLSRFQREGLI